MGWEAGYYRVRGDKVSRSIMQVMKLVKPTPSFGGATIKILLAAKNLRRMAKTALELF